jgi:hypothetical protein
VHPPRGLDDALQIVLRRRPQLARHEGAHVVRRDPVEALGAVEARGIRAVAAPEGVDGVALADHAEHAEAVAHDAADRVGRDRMARGRDDEAAFAEHERDGVDRARFGAFCEETRGRSPHAARHPVFLEGAEQIEVRGRILGKERAKG